MKPTALLFNFILISVSLSAQQRTPLLPSGLMVDLIEHADYQSVHGYAIPSSEENLSDPAVQSVFIGSQQPSFTWEIGGRQSGIRQTAYQVLVSDNVKMINDHIGNLWDSGKIKSGLSAGITYQGKPLQPNKAYYWQVRVWNNNQEASPYASPARFYTGKALTAHQSPSYPLTVNEQMPLSFELKENIYRADFENDAFGKLKINLFSASGGDSVIVHLAEVRNADGSINRTPGGSRRYARYVLYLQKGTHTYLVKIRTNAVNTRSAAIKMPLYIGEVTPFRYCEVEGYTGQLNKEDLTRLAVNYHFDDTAVQFKSSDTVLNAVWELCKYSMKATSFAGIYVDGDRERVPYEADAYINQLSHYAADKEFSLARNSHEYLINHATWPTEWILQSVLIAGTDYLYTGDLQSAKFHYEDLKAKSLMALADSTLLISTLTGKVTKELLKTIHYEGPGLKDIVDWPHSGILGLDAKDAGETDGFVFSTYNAVVNAYYYKSLLVMKLLATDLGKTDDAAMFDKKAKAFKIAYKKAFFDPSRNVFKDGKETDHASLHTNVFALTFGLVEEQHQQQVLDFIESRGMSCSVYGSQFLLDAVYDGGGGKYGLALLTSKTDRSWYNMIRVGSTITLEAWDNKYKPNQDWNHAWGAAPANIISRKLMGVEPRSPGWATFSVKPQIADLKEASINVPTVKGSIDVAYKQSDVFFYTFLNVPANTSCDLSLPLKGSNYEIWINGKAVKARIIKQRAVISAIGSGSHEIKLVYVSKK